jgi:hypothetical protein
VTTRGKYKAWRKTGARRQTSGLVIAYVFFLLFPHFEAVSHVHDGGEGLHHHKFLSAHDVALEREALGAFPQGNPGGELAPTPARPSKTYAPYAVGEYGRSLTDSNPPAHTHFQEDPNLPALGVDSGSPTGVLTALPAPETIPPFVPALAILASTARAPPRC